MKPNVYLIVSIIIISVIFTSDQKIYALYCGETLLEATPNHGSQIHVFDWTGNPLCQYHIDPMISSLTVDEKNAVIYGLRRDDDQPIIKFDMKSMN